MNSPENSCRKYIMPRFHKDEVTKLEDIEALLVTARDLAERFTIPQLSDTGEAIRNTLATLRRAKSKLIDEWRASDSHAPGSPGPTDFGES